MNLIHDWSEPQDAIFVLEACWYESKESVEHVVVHISKTLEDAIHYMKTCTESFLSKNFWWEVSARYIGSRNINPHYIGLFDRYGTQIENIPSKFSYIDPNSHIVNCKTCQWKYIAPVAKFLRFDQTYGSSRYYKEYMLTMMQPTGRVYPNGVEISVRPESRLFFVSEDNIEFSPGGSPMVPTKTGDHW